VVVIVLDDVGRDEVYPDVSFTPTIERFASQGVRFERAYSWPVCSPTRYALNFGRYPRRNGIGDVINALEPQVSPSPPPPRGLASLAEVFAATHETALFGKWHLGRAGLAGEMDQPTSGPFVQGFDRWLAGMPNGASRGAQGETHYQWNRVEDGALSTSNEYATRAQYEAFVDWWTSTCGPRFAWLGFAAAHPPFDPPPGFGVLATERENYQQMIAYLDQEALARVADVIDLAHTYVVIVGDNGTPDDARPQGSATNHFKGTVFEGGIRVPLVIAGPGVTRLGAVSDRLVSLVDLPATILELAGSPLPPGRFEDSCSFADELSMVLAGNLPRTFVFTERYTDSLDEMAVVESRWKLRRFDPDGPQGPLGYRDQLYDLESDPLEASPILPGAGFDAEFARLGAELDSIPPRAP
jgi:arylsulfatase A-like enzyme